MEQKILIVDDEPLIVEGLTAYLECEEMDATGAHDRASAMAIVGARHFSIIVADLCLRTVEEGLLLIDEVRRVSPRSRIITMTGYAHPELEAEVLARGSAKLLHKSEGERVLVEAILEVLAEIEREADNAGDADLESLYLRTMPLLRSIPTRRFRLSAAQAEDVVQDAWLLFLEKRGLVHTPRSWLAGTVSNLCLRMLDRLRRVRSADDDETFEQIPAADDATDTRLMINEAMSRIDSRSRELCRRIGMEGSSYAEVSEGMSLPIGSIGPLYIRAKERLRRSLEC
jgi:RNA polymerase sigma factor (sigma-70 family)